MIEIDLDKISKNELTTILIEKDKEIERLKELCNKYEEEHNTTFETWQKDIKENKKLHSIIKEVREYIDYYGITPEQNDDVTVRHILKGILKILDKGSDK